MWGCSDIGVGVWLSATCRGLLFLFLHPSAPDPLLRIRHPYT
nr:MAG TPA: hypothetical protein [Caudoviricetes sp.]